MTCTTTQLDFCVPQGTTWKYELTLYLTDDATTPRDITDDEFKLQVRETKGSSRVLLELDSVAGDIVKPDPTNGVLRLEIDPAKTIGIRIKEDQLAAVYDLELTDTDGDVLRIIEGEFLLTREVTR